MFPNIAYIVINSSPSKTKKVYQRLKILPEVKNIQIVSGPYDIIVLLKTNNASKTFDIVLEKIRCTDGVSNTMTCFVARNEFDYRHYRKRKNYRKKCD